MILKNKLTGLILAGLVLLAVVVVVATRQDRDPVVDNGFGLAPPSSEKTHEPPTTDLFGNRLEAPVTPEGEALPQNPAARPDPTRIDYLKTPPAGMQWQRGWGGAALPFSGSDGPTRVVDGIASGFAHTPQGAALAACDALARALSAPDSVWQNVVRARFLGGGQPLISRIAANRARTPDIATYLAVPEGIRVLPNFQPDLAVVEIAMRAPNGWAYGTWPMTWQAGDWRVRVPDPIDALWQPAVQLYSLNEFGSWKGSTS